MSDTSLPRTFRRLAPKPGTAATVPGTSSPTPNGYSLVNGAVIVPHAMGRAEAFTDLSGRTSEAYDSYSIFDPQKPPHRHILIQDTEGSGSPVLEMDLSAVDPALVSWAREEAARMIPELTSDEDLQDRNALACHLMLRDPRVVRPVEDLREAFHSVVQAPGLAAPVRDFSSPAVESTPESPVGAAKVAAAAPVSSAIRPASFGAPVAEPVVAAAPAPPPPPPTIHPLEVLASRVVRAPGSPLRSTPREPGRKAWFKYEHHEVTTYYHEVIEAGASLILCWDESWRYGRMFPRLSEREDANSFAVVLDESATVYYVEMLGTEFSHNGWTYCVLSIADKVVYADSEV